MKEDKDHLRRIARGVIKRTLIYRLQRGDPLTPLSNGATIAMVKHYILRSKEKSYHDYIIASAKRAHRLESQRILKSLRAINQHAEKRFEQYKERPSNTGAIKSYLCYLYLTEEFVITKQQINRKIDVLIPLIPALRNDKSERVKT